MLGLFGSLLPFGLKLVTWMIDKSIANAEQKKRMLALIQAAQNEAAIAKKNKDELKKQRLDIETESRQEIK